MKTFNIKRSLTTFMAAGMILTLPLASHGARPTAPQQADEVADAIATMKCHDGTVFYQSPGHPLRPSLCDDHGGVNAGGGIGGGHGNGVKPGVGLPAEVRKAPLVGGGKVGTVERKLKEGSGKAQLRSPAKNPVTAPQRAPAQDYNAARSNKPSS